MNNIISVLRIMLKEAYRAGSLSWDPSAKDAIRALGKNTQERGRLTAEEVRKLLDEKNVDKVWGGHRLYRAIALTAAATGCRQGELLALRDEDVHDDYLHIAPSFSSKTRRIGPTKNKQARDVPLPPKVREAIAEFMGSGKFVFSSNGGKSPATGNLVSEAFNKAVVKSAWIGSVVTSCFTGYVGG